MRRFDHIDLRVGDLERSRPFYERLLPALGFSHEADVPGWLQYERNGTDAVGEFVGVSEKLDHTPNECRIAFWAESPAEVDRLSAILAEAGARKIEGPAFETPDYYAVFFEDPSGNRFEICHRTAPIP